MKTYTIKQVAGFFGKTPGWVYWCLKNGRFVYENGDPIKPAKETAKGSKKEFDLDAIQEFAMSLYRFGQLNDAGLRDVIGEVLTEKEKDLESKKEVEDA